MSRYQPFKRMEAELNDKPGVRNHRPGRQLRGRKKVSGARHKMLAQFVKRNG